MRPGDVLLEFADANADNLGTLFSNAAATVNAEIFAGLSARGHTVRPAHMPVIVGLDPEGTKVSVLAGRAGISRQAMSALVRDVEVAGHVRTSPDPTDGRAILVELTDLGADLCRDAGALLASISERWRSELGVEHFTTMVDGARTIGDSARSR